MTDPTTAPAVEGAAFDTSTAAGRLRILWGATADPQLAMSEDEVADVQTVLDEHAEMATELEQLRTIQATLTARVVQHADLLHRAGRELVSGQALRSEQQLREMAERDRDEAREELARVGGMTPAELLAWRAER